MSSILINLLNVESDSQRDLPADEGVLAPEPQRAAAGPAAQEVAPETGNAGSVAQFPIGFLKTKTKADDNNVFPLHLESLFLSRGSINPFESCVCT